MLRKAKKEKCCHGFKEGVVRVPCLSTLGLGLGLEGSGMKSPELFGRS